MSGVDFSFLGEEFQFMVIDWENKEKQGELNTNMHPLEDSEEDCKIIDEPTTNSSNVAPPANVAE